MTDQSQKKKSTQTTESHIISKNHKIQKDHKKPQKFKKDDKKKPTSEALEKQLDSQLAKYWGKDSIIIRRCSGQQFR